MNFWQFLWQVLQCLGARWNRIANVLWNNKLKVLSLVQVTVATVSAATGIIPKEHLPYWMLANGLLGVWMGIAHPNDPKVDITVPKPKEVP